MTKDLPNVRVESFDGLLVDYMNEIGDDSLVTVKEVTNDLGKVFARLSAPLNEVLNLSNIE